jgi:hypothetical protein
VASGTCWSKRLKENGHDGIVYSNQAEGPGDSYVIFDPSKKVMPRFGPQ